MAGSHFPERLRKETRTLGDRKEHRMMPSSRCVALELVRSLLLFGCTVSWASSEEKLTGRNMAPETRSFTIAVEGVERSYLLHIPATNNLARKRPVVIMFHGGGGTAKAAMWETQWDEKADKEGFLAVFPEGTPPDRSRPGRFRDNPQTWNDGSNRPDVGAARRGVPDVEFVSAILSDLKARFSVDERRIYVTGFSNGASMAFRVARELSTTVAAVAPVAGADWQADKTPERPVPLLYITGTADPLNPLAGGEIRIGLRSFGKKPATHQMIGQWIKLHGCLAEPRVVYDKDGAKGVAYSLAGDTASVVFYTIDRHGHHWPGGRSALPESLAGKNTANLNATDVIWEFFKGHSRDDKKEAQSGAPADTHKPRR